MKQGGGQKSEVVTRVRSAATLVAPTLSLEPKPPTLCAEQEELRQLFEELREPPEDEGLTPVVDLAKFALAAFLPRPSTELDSPVPERTPRPEPEPEPA